jgi:hypothetical protein
MTFFLGKVVRLPWQIRQLLTLQGIALSALDSAIE